MRKDLNKLIIDGRTSEHLVLFSINLFNYGRRKTLGGSIYEYL